LAFDLFSSLLFWEIVAVLAVAAVACEVFVGGRLRSAPQRVSDARRILDERYVRGEIGRNEYEQMRRDLKA
jgi:uncharacterized membrane protein